MNEDINVAANTEEVATPQETEVATNTEVTAEPTETVEATDVTQTQAFSYRLKDATAKAEQRAKDAVIAELYGNQGITTYDQYQEALRRQQMEQEAQQRNIDPQFYSEFQMMKDEVNASKREKTLYQQDTQLSNDPRYGQLYSEWKNEVHAIANEFNVDYDTAFTYLTREKLPDIISKQKLQAEQEAIKGIQTNAASSPGSISQGGANTNVSFAKMDKKSFEEYKEKVKRGEIK